MHKFGQSSLKTHKHARNKKTILIFVIIRGEKSMDWKGIFA